MQVMFLITYGTPPRDITNDQNLEGPKTEKKHKVLESQKVIHLNKN